MLSTPKAPDGPPARPRRAPTGAATGPAKKFLPIVLMSALLGVACGAEPTSRFTPIQSIFRSLALESTPIQKTGDDAKASRKGPTPAQIAKEREARRLRQRERNERVKKAMKSVRPSDVQRVDKVEVEAMAEKHGNFRRNLWGGSGSVIEYLDSGEDYDMWSQAYRMLGGFIDCDHKKDENGSHDENNGEVSKGCSRWMMWAAYVDPNYQGNGYYEYHGEEPVGALDCHVPESDWLLLGVYRQEFYQFIEQISKHLWELHEYDYIVALAGLAYMTDADCFYVDTTDSGDYIYAGVQPLPEGKFQMALYTDDDCLVPDENLLYAGKTFDDYGLYSDIQLHSGDEGYGDDDQYEWIAETWQNTQEYTLTLLNEVYESYKYCTSCIDYPTYQDGYLIGDTGTDDDDVINQCWKFYSHDSFTCESDCIALGHSQGTIVSVEVGGVMFGTVLSGYYSGTSGHGDGTATESSFSRLVANAFVTFSFIVFVATFLAFAVARRSRYRESRSARSRRLLDDDRQGRRSRRSKSRKREEADGLFRTSSKSRSKSGSRRSKSKSGRSRSSRRRAGEGKSRESSRDQGDYEPPTTSSSDKRSSRRSSSKARSENEPSGDP